MNSRITCSRLLLGITGSIQATIFIQAIQTIKSFAQEIRIIMTEDACEMIRPEVVQLHSSADVYVKDWDGTRDLGVPHVVLSSWADLFVVMPATANILGKAANGIADDLLSTSIVAARPSSTVFCPAMNNAMWLSPAVRRNVETLRADGRYVIDPEPTLSLASGSYDEGLGCVIDDVIPHLKHVQMRNLKNSYFDEATRDEPQTPSARKAREGAIAEVESPR